MTATTVDATATPTGSSGVGRVARVIGPVCAGLLVPVVRDGPYILGALVVAPAILLALSAIRRAGPAGEPLPGEDRQ